LQDLSFVLKKDSWDYRGERFDFDRCPAQGMALEQGLT
jgi:hypothetical protein